eukprot:1117419-Pyramimonas_sp.AAC.1
MTRFRKLSWVARDLAKEVNKRNGQMCLEWPTPCGYWHDPQVKEFLSNYNTTKIQLHGCAYGFKNNKGQYMKKPRTIASSSSVIAEGLVRRCDGSHKSVETRGKECKQAEEYTDEFARNVHLLALRALEDKSSERA